MFVKIRRCDRLVSGTGVFILFDCFFESAFIHSALWMDHSLESALSLWIRFIKTKVLARMKSTAMIIVTGNTAG